MATRRTTFLTAVAVLACVLVPAGILLLATGVSGHHDGRTVLGILAGVAGLICLRILHWARRIRLMTQVGLSFHVDSEPDDGNHRGRSGQDGDSG